MTRQQRSAFLRQPVLTVDDRRIITAGKVLERDKAVPASTLTTDGQEVTTRKEVTVLTAALAHRTSIPAMLVITIGRPSCSTFREIAMSSKG